MLRFAPSPNGPLHLGHALSGFANQRMAGALGAKLLVRLEDIDVQRCTKANIDAVLADLDWLGIRSEGPVWRQSERFDQYRPALEALKALGLVYPSFATRKEIAAATPPGAPRDPDGAPLFPGDTLAVAPDALAARRDVNAPAAWRLDMAKAAALAGPLTFVETDGLGARPQTRSCDPLAWGDVVLARKDMPTSYHLAVVVDDAAQGITHIVRGRDLYFGTAIHRLLQTLLGLPVPCYHHHGLILGPDGRKLSKSRGDQGLAVMRGVGVDPSALRAELLERLDREDREPERDREE